MGVKQTLGAWWWAVETQWAAEQTNPAPGVKHCEAWAVLNARTGYSLQAGDYKHEFTLGVNNIGNSSYKNFMATSRGQEVRDPGLNGYANWRVSF